MSQSGLHPGGDVPHYPVPPSRRGVLMVAGLTALVLLPFVTKPFHIDDTVFVRVAEQILRDPLHPYALDYNWDGVPKPMWSVSQHPPLHSYVLAVVGGILGMHELPLHLAYLGFAVGCAVLMYLLACRLCPYPVLATLLVVLTPGFLVSASNLMADVMMLFFWLLAIWGAMRYADKQEAWVLWLAGAAAAGAAMTKYFGICVLPLIAVYVVPQTHRSKPHLAALTLPVLVLAGWGWYSLETGGVFHPLGAAHHAIASDRGNDPQYLLDSSLRIGRTLAFVGGTLIWPVLLLPAVSRLPVALIVGTVLGAIAMTVAETLTISEKVAQGGQHLLEFLLIVFVGLIVLAAALLEWKRRPDLDTWLLGLWMAGTLVFAGLINWSVNARVVLPALFPVTVLFVRWIASLQHSELWIRGLRVALVPAAACAVLVCLGDLEFARAGKAFAQSRARQLLEQGERVYFKGHWGFQYYMEEEGAEPADLEGMLQRGGLIVYPMYNAKNGILSREWKHVSFHPYLNSYRVHTTSPDLSAGFYSSIFGFLPFGFGKQHPDYPPLADGFRIDRIGVAPAAPQQVGQIVSQRTAQRRASDDSLSQSAAIDPGS